MAKEEDDFVAEMMKKVNSKPLSEELFMELVGLSNDAMAGTLRTIPPDEERCLEDLPEGTLVLTDAPENQMGFAVIGRCKEKFGREEGEQVSMSFLHRWFAIVRARHNGVIDEFVKPCDDGMLIHDGVFRAAATLNIGPGGFNEDEYVGKIREIIHAEGEGNNGP